MEQQEQQYQTISKFDRILGSLQGANNLAVKATTIQTIEGLTGEAETYVVQTVRAEYKAEIRKGLKIHTETRVGDFIVLHIVDKEGTKRVILPPRVTDTIKRQAAALDKKATAKRKADLRERMKLAMQERMANGFVPTFQKKGPVAV